MTFRTSFIGCQGRENVRELVKGSAKKVFETSNVGDSCDHGRSLHWNSLCERAVPSSFDPSSLLDHNPDNSKDSSWNPDIPWLLRPKSSRALQQRALCCKSDSYERHSRLLRVTGFHVPSMGP